MSSETSLSLSLHIYDINIAEEERFLRRSPDACREPGPLSGDNRDEWSNRLLKTLSIDNNESSRIWNSMLLPSSLSLAFSLV